MNLVDFLICFSTGIIGGVISGLIILICRVSFDYISDRIEEKRFNEYKEFVEFQKNRQRGD